MTMRILLLALVVALAAGCATNRAAPVVERQTVPPPPAQAEAPPPAQAEAPPPKPIPTHTVKRGETLVGIALQYGLDYREVAALNNITNVNVISVGQVLVLAAPAGAAPLVVNAPLGATPLAPAGTPIESRPLANTDKLKVEPRGQKVPFSERALAQMSTESGVSMPPPVAVAPSATLPPVPVPAPEPERPAPGTDSEDVDWMWPVKGKPTAGFTESSKGVDLLGKKGTPVLAAAAGRVIYAGELRAYGRLVIIKHNATWVSAYAHNDKIVVKEQQDVRKGEKIAEMGSTDTDAVKLHFEVRRHGKPVDPAKILPAP
jgi:lipoprotein NlpD